MKHKHKWSVLRKERKCIGHEYCGDSPSGHFGVCMQLGFNDDPKGGGHKDYFIFACDCGAEKEIETKESKKEWRKK